MRLAHSKWIGFFNACARSPLQVIFALYVLALSFLLIVHNPFAYVPIDEEMVEEGFGLNLTPHVLAFSLLAILGLVARFRHPGWLYLGMFAYAAGTELLQGLLNPWLGRCCDWIDFVDNVQGLVYGGLGFLLSTRFRLLRWGATDWRKKGAKPHFPEAGQGEKLDAEQKEEPDEKPDEKLGKELDAKQEKEMEKREEEPNEKTQGEKTRGDGVETEKREAGRKELRE